MTDFPRCGRLAWLTMTGLVLLAGCGRGGIPLAPVEGVVTLDGTPVAEAGVVFSPSDPTLGPPASGSTDTEGHFTLFTANRPGALLGDHHVAISKDETIIEGYINGMPQYRTKEGLPPQYALPSTSGLKATVIDDDNNFEFGLVSKK